MHQTGIPVPIWQIRDRRSQTVAEFDLRLLSDITPYPYRFHLEQHKLTPIILDLLRKQPAAEIRFSTAFVGVEQDAGGVRATVESGNEASAKEVIEGSWLIGADGEPQHRTPRGRLRVRGAFTWPELFFVISITHDLEQHGYAKNAYIADPQEWMALFKMPDDGPPGIWRVIFPVDPTAGPPKKVTLRAGCDRRADARLHSDGGPLSDQVQELLPGAPARRARLPQRPRAPRGRRSTPEQPARRIPASIAAFTTPRTWSRSSAASWRGEAEVELLDLYVRQRRTACVEYAVQAMSIRNKRHARRKRVPRSAASGSKSSPRRPRPPSSRASTRSPPSMIAGLRHAQTVT